MKETKKRHQLRASVPTEYALYIDELSGAYSFSTWVMMICDEKIKQGKIKSLPAGTDEIKTIFNDNQ